LNLCSRNLKLEPGKDLLSSYGTLTELVLPTDEVTKRPKGFAFVEYQMPENAVRAMAELDGSSFQGRIMHVLPGKNRPDQCLFTRILRPRSHRKEKLRTENGSQSEHELQKRENG
jgi:RNA recognition motif-containing protein